MPFQVFLQQIFHPFQVNHHEQSLKKLNELGGYQVFLNELIIQSDSSNFEGSNDKKQHFLEYILLYLVSLSLFSKILLYYHNAIDSLKILSESIGIIFLGVLIVWKKKRDQIHINQNKQSSHRTSKNKYNVHRNGQDLQIQENQLKQGDYVYITAPQVLQFDAILFQVEKNSSMDQSSYKYVLVNEKAVDPSRSETPKYSIKEACDNHELDPFLFRNSTLQEGSCWAIVCAVGGRKPSEIFSESVEHRLLGLSKAKNFVRVVKAWIVLPILLLGVQWMSLKEGNRYEVFLKFLSLVASLLLYLQYANQNEMLWLIIGYFSESQQGENYKIKDDKIMYKLQTIDVIAIQQDNFSQYINELSELACSYDIKIITTKSQKRIENEFAFLAENIVFKDDLSLSIKKRLQMLNKSKFISCSVSFFVQYYLPLLQSMKFSVLFIPNQEQMKLVCSNLPKNSDNYRQLDDYIKIKNRNILLQSFLQLEERSRKMIRLRNCYIGILFNSCIELIIMILWACKGCIIELNLNLFILYTTRNKSLQLFQDYKSETYVNVTEQKHRWWALNLALIFYYIFMMQEINCSQDRQYLLFLFLMTNRLFRLQPLHLHSDRRKIKYIKRVGGIIFLMIINACLGYYQMRKWQIKTEWEAILLFPLIIWLYSTFL